MNELIVIPKETALEVFTQTNGLDSYIRQIEDEVNSFVPDISTAKSRAAIASIASKIAKSKTYLDGVGKELVDKLKEQPKLVDAERKRMRDKLDALKDQVRKPLTDWENAEESRIDEIKTVLEMMKQIPDAGFGSVAIATHLKRLKSTVIDKERFMEFTEDAAVIKDEYVERCERLLVQVEKHEEEQKELERLRAEKVAREQKEREERLVKEAEERGKREAEEAAKREIEKVQAAAFAAQEKLRIEREAEDRAKAAIEEGKERMRLAEEAKKEAERLEKDRAAKELEYQREQQKLRDEALKEAEAKRLAQEEAARIANEDHRKKIISETIESLIDLEFDEGHAENIVMLILEGKVKHVSIKF